MFASDLKVVPITANDVNPSKSDNNNSPMIRYQKTHFSQKYQNNVQHHHNNNGNNRKKFPKIPTVNNSNNNNNNNLGNSNSNKNHHNNNGQSYTANNRKKHNNQYNSTCTTKPNNNNNNNNNNNITNINITNNINNNNITNNNNSNANKNVGSYTPTRNTNSNIVNKHKTNYTNNICSDQNLVPKSRCDTIVSKNIATDLSFKSTSQKVAAQAPVTATTTIITTTSTATASATATTLSRSNASVLSSNSLSSSSTLSSSSLSSTTHIDISNNTNTNNKNRVANRYNSAPNHHRRKVQTAEVDNNNQNSPIPIMVVNSSGGSNRMQNNQQLPVVFAAPICTTTTSAPSSAPVSPNSYSLNFLHSVGGVQKAGGNDSRHTANNHPVYSSSASVSPVGSTHNFMQGQRIVYQEIQQPEKRNANNGQRKYSPNVHSPPYNRSYDIPILINNNHHSGGENFSSSYNYPLQNNNNNNNNNNNSNNNNNYKRNTYIPVSYLYAKSQNDNYSPGNHTPTYTRNRNQSKTWNTGAHKNPSNGMAKHNSDYASSQMNSRVRNHQNVNNLIYVVTNPENNKNLNGSNSSRSESSSPKPDNEHFSNRTTNISSNMLTQVPAMGKGDSFSPGGGSDTHHRVASEGYESDCSNSSSDKRTSTTEHSNFLSSSSSSQSSAEIPYHPPLSISHSLNFPPHFIEDDASLQQFYGSDSNLSRWVPALQAQFMISAHGICPNGNFSEYHQQQLKSSQTNRSSYRGGRGRNNIHNNVRSMHFTNKFLFTPADRFLGRSHVAEIREVPRTLLTCSKWDNLSQGVWDKFMNAQQTEDTFKRKIKLWRYLYILIKNTYPRLGIYLVGSTMSGFGADSSDIDMCLVSRACSTLDPRIEALFNLTLLKDCLARTGEFENFNLIEAKVPILRFRDRTHNLEVDLNYNNCVGIKNTHLLFCYSQLDWRLRPLVLVTKLWAQYHDINNAKNMTISSYSLVLMVIHFLQCGVNPPVLPCLHEMYPDKFLFLQRINDFGFVDMSESIGPYNSKNTQSLGQLFLEFLHYYSNFNYSQYAISIRTGTLIPIEYCRHAVSIKNNIHQWKQLCIEEPFDLTNTARSVYDPETFERVKLVFISSYKVLQETLDINSIFAPLDPAKRVLENN